MRVVYEKQAIKTFTSMPVKTAQRIREKISAFALHNPNYGLSALKTKETRHPREGGGPGDWVINLVSCDSWIPAFAGMTAFLLV